jgi:hypothetical protein
VTGGRVTIQTELNTLTSSLDEVATRITKLVENDGATMSADVYTELVAAERTIGALLRRLNRVSTRVR